MYCSITRKGNGKLLTIIINGRRKYFYYDIDVPNDEIIRRSKTGLVLFKIGWYGNSKIKADDRYYFPQNKRTGKGNYKMIERIETPIIPSSQPINDNLPSQYQEKGG
jgi:hypothetical protein